VDKHLLIRRWLDQIPRPAATVAELGQDANFEPECPPVGLDEIVDRVVLGRLVTVVGSGRSDVDDRPTGVFDPPLERESSRARH
jgi:hypothetical protein